MHRLPVITYHLCHVLTPVPASQHDRRRRLLAGRCDVTHYVVVPRDVSGGQRADGVLRHNDVIFHATGEKKGLLCDIRSDHWRDLPGGFHHHRCTTIIQSSCSTGRLNSALARVFLSKAFSVSALCHFDLCDVILAVSGHLMSLLAIFSLRVRRNCYFRARGRN